MSLGVVLRKFIRYCPSCKAALRVRTHPRQGTLVTASCNPYTCRIERMLVMAGTPRRAGFELLPADDRHVRKVS